MNEFFIWREFLLKFPYQNYHELPRIQNLTLHTTVGQTVSQSLTGSPASKLKDFHEFTGQRPSLTQARKANASFGIRKGERIGCKISFRHKEWQNFVNRHFICCGSIIAKAPKQTKSLVGRVGIRSDLSSCPQTSFGGKSFAQRSKVQSISFGLHTRDPHQALRGLRPRRDSMRIDRHLSGTQGMEANIRMRISRRVLTVFVCRRTEALLFLYSYVN